jgi:microcystin-dependent protein
MSEPFIGEIRMFAGTFAPSGWALCNGQTMSIAQWSALFAILGTTYGGNGQTTFQLPNLQSRVPVHAGQGTGLSQYVLGQTAGVENVTLNQSQLPPHTHQATFTPTGGGSPLSVGVTVAVANTSTGNVSDPTNNIIAVPKPSGPGSIVAYQPASAATGQLGGVAVNVSGSPGITGGSVTNAIAGSGQPTPITQPVLCVNFIIALQGIFPSRN